MVKGPASFDQGLFLMHLHKGKEYFEQNQFQKAREELEAAYHLRPQDEKILNMLGMTYFKLEMLPQAEEMYVTLTSNNPDVYTLQSNLGLIRLKMDKLEKAEDSLTRALELQPSNPKAHFYLGLLYEKLERFEKALFHFEKAHADKMIRKVKQKVEELKSKEYTLLPFTIVEVLEPEQAAIVDDGTMHQTSVAPQETVAQESTATAQPQEKFEMTEKEITAVAPESEWREGGSSTGKMRRSDVMEAMDRVDDREEEEELVEDVDASETAHAQEGIAEEEGRPWEKTEPAFHPTMRVEPESIAEPMMAESVAGFIPSTAPDPSFFNADDMAADISSFLAQSRNEEPVVEEDFVQEPPGVNATEEDHSVDSNEDSHADYEEVAKIPTPEEVENAVTEMQSDTNKPSIDEPAEEQPAEEPPNERVPFQEPPVEQSPVEEPEDEQPVEEPPKEELSQHPFGEDVIEESVERSFSTALMPEPRTGEPIEHTIAMDLVENVEPLRTQELFQPANLDQFSRDRYYVQPLIGADRFLLIDPHLLEIIISDRLIVRKGTISSFTGNLSFESWQKQMEDTLPLLQVSGAGVLFLADRRQDIYLISLNNETLYVEANHLLVVQSALKVEPHFFKHNSTDPGFSMVKVSGRGTIALTCQSKPLTLNVYEAMPANIPADALIAWSGRLGCEVLADPEIRNIMMQPEGTILLRFTGAGDVVVEQGSLWGERRTKK